MQLIEQQKALGFSSLKYMAEEVEGSFVFTVLDRRDQLYIVKGDNPLCICHFLKTGLFVYASTEEILQSALSGIGFLSEKPVQITIKCGEILCIGADGALERQTFDNFPLYSCWNDPIWWGYRGRPWKPAAPETDAYLKEVKAIAVSFGYAPEDIDQLEEKGFTPEEIEEFLYEGELCHACQ